MEKSTPIGLVAACVLVFGTILMGDGWQSFIDIPSLIIVLGGTIAALLVAFTMDQVKGAPAAFKSLFGYQTPELESQIGDFVELARLVRRDGLLALDKKLGETEDPLTRFGLEMAVDGTDPSEVDELMQIRIGEASASAMFLNTFLNTAGTYAPAFGMVGTLIGLIQMLQNLSDPSAIGPAMAVAMITTFYGAFFANAVFLPLASKQKEQTDMLLKKADITREGVLGLIRGDSPAIIEKRLRQYVGGEGGEGDGGSADMKLAA